MMIKIPDEVETALSTLHNRGFEAYIVGGCVRDSIMGKTPSDWDIATSAKPEEILWSFNKFRTIETGLKHGTVTVIVKKMQIEITTYRIDGEYSDKRHPDHVTFTDKIELDLMRRDFTINSLAYNKNGIIDLFGGIHFISNKL
jgi:tRNA nucleotidyltransferase (CCA-adding enzyme)